MAAQARDWKRSMETAMAVAAGNRQPLLGDRAAELDPERGILVEGSNVTRSEVAADVQRSLAEHPRETIKWIEEFGCTRLGSFRVHVSPPSPSPTGKVFAR